MDISILSALPQIQWKLYWAIKRKIFNSIHREIEALAIFWDIMDVAKKAPIFSGRKNTILLIEHDKN